MRAHTSTSLGIVIALGILALHLPTARSGELERLPPDPARVHEWLAGHPGAVARAVARAETVAEGLARSLDVDLESGTVEVVVARADGVDRVLRVDLARGDVLDDRVRGRFPGVLVTGEGVRAPSGLLYFDLVEGDGAYPASSRAKVEVHYSGWLLDGTLFDSSVERGQSLVFALDQVIAGWTEGVGGMRVGGRRKLVVPASLAYGETGSPGTIPGGATLVFDVELLSLP